jgi:hypothetical protein
MAQTLELERAEVNLRSAVKSRPREMIGELEKLFWWYYERAHELYLDFVSGKLGVDEFVRDADSPEGEFRLDANLALQRLVESDATRRLAEIAGVRERLALLANLPVILRRAGCAEGLRPLVMWGESLSFALGGQLKYALCAAAIARALWAQQEGLAGELARRCLDVELERLVSLSCALVEAARSTGLDGALSPGITEYFLEFRNERLITRAVLIDTSVLLLLIECEILHGSDNSTRHIKLRQLCGEARRLLAERCKPYLISELSRLEFSRVLLRKTLTDQRLLTYFIQRSEKPAKLCLQIFNEIIAKMKAIEVEVEQEDLAKASEVARHLHGRELPEFNDPERCDEKRRCNEKCIGRHAFNIILFAQAINRSVKVLAKDRNFVQFDILYSGIKPECRSTPFLK